MFLLGTGFGVYQKYTGLIEENRQYIQKIAILEMQKNSLSEAIKKQSDEISKYKNDLVSYKEQIETLNKELEEELNAGINFETMDNDTVTDKEAIEWLKTKRKILHY